MNFIQFISSPQNALLALVAVTSGGALAWSFFKESGGGGLSPSEVTLKMNRDNPVLIDVRAQGEYEEGHIVGAHHVPLDHFNADHSDWKKWQESTVIVYCGTGMRSNTALQRMKKLGFKQAFHLKGGISSWTEAGLPVEKGRISHHKHNKVK